MSWSSLDHGMALRFSVFCESPGKASYSPLESDHGFAAARRNGLEPQISTVSTYDRYKIQQLTAIEKCLSACFTHNAGKNRSRNYRHYFAFPETPVKIMVGPNGLEPSTSSVSGRRSNQLSYGPTCVAETASTRHRATWGYAAPTMDFIMGAACVRCWHRVGNEYARAAWMQVLRCYRYFNHQAFLFALNWANHRQPK